MCCKQTLIPIYQLRSVRRGQHRYLHLSLNPQATTCILIHLKVLVHQVVRHQEVNGPTPSHMEASIQLIHLHLLGFTLLLLPDIHFYLHHLVVFHHHTWGTTLSLTNLHRVRLVNRLAVVLQFQMLVAHPCQVPL